MQVVQNLTLLLQCIYSVFTVVLWCQWWTRNGWLLYVPICLRLLKLS